MSHSITPNGTIVTEYLERYPTMFKLTIARLIYKDHPEAFTNVESVRSLIRYHTGTNGDENRDCLTNTRFIGACQPPTDATPREDFILPATANNILILPDIHCPYHDTEAIDATLQWGKSHKVNTVIIDGDFVDFVRLSKFVPDPRARDLRYEMDCAYEMMYYIANTLPNAKVYFLPGNHDIRVDKYLQLKAPELLGAEPELSNLDAFLHLSDFGVSYLKNAQIIQAGKLFIGHGHEWRGGAGGVNPSRTFFLRSYSNFIGGHFHRTSENSERKLDGSVESCWSMGCLCGLSPDYMPYNKWNHGFANVKTNIDGTFRVFNAKIFNGKIL